MTAKELVDYVRGVAVELEGREGGPRTQARWVPARGERENHDLTVYEDGSVDVIVGEGALERCADPVAALREWRRVLREGGTLALRDGPQWSAACFVGVAHLVGGFEVEDVEPVEPEGRWTLVARRRAVAEVRAPLAILGPMCAAAARRDDAAAAELRFQVGSILLQAGDPSLALACFEKLPEDQQRTAEVSFATGMCKTLLSRFDAALADLQRAASLDPRNEQIPLWIEQCRDPAPRTDAPEATVTPQGAAATP